MCTLPPCLLPALLPVPTSIPIIVISVANVLFAGMFATIGSAHLGFGTTQVHVGQALGWVAVPHAVCEAAISAQADAAGLGHGRLQGDVGNFIALIKVFVPMVYGQAMGWGSRHGIPGAAIFTASGWWLASSLLFLLVRPSDLHAVAAPAPAPPSTSPSPVTRPIPKES